MNEILMFFFVLFQLIVCYMIVTRECFVISGQNRKEIHFNLKCAIDEIIRQSCLFDK